MTPLPARRWALDLGAAAALLAVPIVGFAPTFGTPAYLPAAIGGALAGLALAALGAWRGLGILVLAAATIGVYAALGTALAVPYAGLFGVLPTLESLRLLALGVVTSWKGLLTTVAPVGTADGHLIVPFLLTLVAGVLIGSLALRVRPPAWALLPAVALVGAQIALGTSQPAAPLVQGLVIALVAVVWLAVRQAWRPARAAVAIGEDGVAAPVGMALRRVVAGAAVLAVATVVGVAGSAIAAPEGPRYVLRDVVIPPFDVRQYPSPLQSFRAYVRDYAEQPLFSVTGLPAGARIRLATMDVYDGTVINVADEGTGSSGAFTPLRSEMSVDAEGTPATLRVEVAALESVWLPDAGAVASIAFEGERAEDLRRSAYYNDETGTAVVTAGLAAGDVYTVRTLLPEERSDASLAETPFASGSLPDRDGVPQALADLASDAVADAVTPIEKVRALEQFLSQEGFFSHGLEGEPLSRAGHGAERIATLAGADQMVGDDEQYAVTMALMAGELGIPARVVMGFHPDDDAAASGTFSATGDTLHAWVEVAFAGAGWVPFDPTPDEDQIPNDQTTKPRADPQPQVLQPPPPEQQPADLPPTVPDDREAEDDTDPTDGILGLVLAIVGGSLLVLLVLSAPFVAIGLLKATRRRRRRTAERTADRISGGWDEVVDTAADYGTPVRTGATRGEDAAVVAAAFAAPAVTTLARRADAEVFGPSDPTPAEVEAFWDEVEGIVTGMGAQRSRWRRLRAFVSLRSLLAGTRFALPAPRPRRPSRADRRRSDAATAPASDAPASAPAATGSSDPSAPVAPEEAP